MSTAGAECGDLADVTIPDMGEGIKAVFVCAWIKRQGETVTAGEPLAEVMTDKANIEIPSPASGVLAEILAPVDREVAVGEVIARIRREP